MTGPSLSLTWKVRSLLTRIGILTFAISYSYLWQKSTQITQDRWQYADLFHGAIEHLLIGIFKLVLSFLFLQIDHPCTIIPEPEKFAIAQSA